MLPLTPKNICAALAYREGHETVPTGVVGARHFALLIRVMLVADAQIESLWTDTLFVHRAGIAQVVRSKGPAANTGNSLSGGHGDLLHVALLVHGSQIVRVLVHSDSVIVVHTSGL